MYLNIQEHQNDKIKSCLSWLHQRAMCGPDSFKLCFLEDLSLELFTHASKNVSESSILNMLTTSVFDYEPNTRCRTSASVVSVENCITGSAVALHCCKAHAKINGKIENSTPCKIVTREDFNLKLGTRD